MAALQEFYEPLFEQIWREAPKQGFRIRAIWIADPAAMGVSGSLNEHRLGNERESRQASAMVARAKLIS